MGQIAAQTLHLEVKYPTMLHKIMKFRMSKHVPIKVIGNKMLFTDSIAKKEFSERFHRKNLALVLTFNSVKL